MFGDHASRLAISSTKSMHGHAMGASGALELVAAVLSLEREMVPPTANYTAPDPECDLDYVPNQARPATRSSFKLLRIWRIECGARAEADTLTAYSFITLSA